MPPVDWNRIEPLLMQVEKPARYVGGEFNQIVKPDAAIRVCLAFPDLYEVGMSYHGYRLLYERLNTHDGWAAERAFTPWPDMERLMREQGVPLYSLETFRPLAEFHWIGFTMQHEVNFSNLLTMLDLAGIPLESKDRSAPFPILVGGGEGAFSPETIAPFLDAFAIGDGEELCEEITECCARAAAEGWDRRRILLALAAIPGIYVPEFYDPQYNPDGTIAAVPRLPEFEGGGVPPARIFKRHYNVARDAGAVRPVVPLLRTIHDRFSIEIRRGCVNGCRFCQAGMITRPVNERPLEQIVEIARQGIENTGYDDVSLLSLSSADYTMIAPLVSRLARMFDGHGVSVSLPSLRINGFDVQLVDEIARVRKSGFTFAPEAGTSRLRDVINKPVDQQYFFDTIDDVLRRGWRTLKFYFMIGLPTETQEDLEGIVQICEHAARLGRKHHGRKAQINVTLSPFVPKSNNPFPWEAPAPRDQVRQRNHYPRRRRREAGGGAVDVKTSDIGLAFIEAVLSRGDRRVAAAIRRSWELGARFDGWNEMFDLGRWLRAFADVGLDPEFYANRERGEDEVFPYEHIEGGLGRRFLWADRRRSMKARVVEKCDTGRCAGCDVCDDTINHTLAQDMDAGGELVADRDHDCSDARTRLDLAEGTYIPTVNRAMEQTMAIRNREMADGDGAIHDADDELDDSAAQPADCDGEATSFGGAEPGPAAMEAVQRLRVTYSRGGALRYLSHLDFIKVLGIVARRARLPLAWSQGFNPAPRIQFAPPLSLGMGGAAEQLDLILVRRLEPEALLERLNAITLAGLSFTAAREVPVRDPSLEEALAEAEYRVELPGVDPAELAAAVERFAAADTFPVQVQKKKGMRSIDLRQSLRRLDLAPGPVPAVTLTLTLETGQFVKPHDALGFLLGRTIALGIDARVERLGFAEHLPLPA